MEEARRLYTISKFYGGQRTANTLNEYFGTDRFFYKFGLTRGCVEIWIKGAPDRAMIEKYQFFIQGLMLGINLG